MTPDLVANLIMTLLTTAGSTITILARMRSYVTVEEYRLKVAALHEIINAQGKQIAVQEANLKRIEERTDRK